MFFMAHTKAMFLVDDNQPKILKLDGLLQQLVRANDNIDPAAGKRLYNGILLFGAAKTRQAFNLYRPLGKAIKKVLMMLVRQ